MNSIFLQGWVVHRVSKSRGTEKVRALHRTPSVQEEVVALLMPRVLSIEPGPTLSRCRLSDSAVGQHRLRSNAAESAAWKDLSTSQGRATVDDVEVLSMLTNISMAVLFVVPGWSTHKSYVQ